MTNLNKSFATASDYEAGLSRLNYQYKINSHSLANFTQSKIFQTNKIIMTYSIVGPSSGVFSRKKDEYTDYVALRFIKKGHEIHESDSHHYVLNDQTIGIFPLNTVSHYQRPLQTEGINLFIEKNNLTKNLLPQLNKARVIDASSGVANYLLESIFMLAVTLTTCDSEEQKLLLSQFVQLLCSWQLQQTPSSAGKEQQLFISATDFIHSSLEDHELTLEKTATHCEISCRSLQEIFAKEHISFSQYVNDLRLTLAAAKLFHTAEEITTIAYQCGFNSSAYFSKRFKEKYQISPRSYRKYHQSYPKVTKMSCNEEKCHLKKLTNY